MQFFKQKRAHRADLKHPFEVPVNAETNQLYAKANYVAMAVTANLRGQVLLAHYHLTESRQIILMRVDAYPRSELARLRVLRKLVEVFRDIPVLRPVGL